jgi:ribosomal protein S26
MTCPAPVNVQCAADVPAANTSSVTTTDNCSGAVTVTHVSDVISSSTCANRFTVTRTYRATDACNNTATCAQTITVNDNTPPSMTCPQPVTVQCSSQVPAVDISSVTTTDNCAGTVTVTHVSDAISNSTCPNRYTITRTYQASDACGNTNTCSQTITVDDNTAPVITFCPADAIIECDASSLPANTGSATASDNCGSVTPTYNDVPDDRGCITYIIRTWTATDACGNSATCVQNITKRDRTGPVITCTSPTTATVSDNCSPVADITKYLSNGIWTAIDGSGNITTANAGTCVQGPVSRSATTQVVQEQTSQTTTVTEEKTKAPVGSRVITQNNITVQTIPNPFNDRVKFVITSPEAGNGGLDIYNMTGQKIKTVYTGTIITGVQTFELSLPTQQVSNLVYVLRVGDKRVTGKILQINQ